MFSFIGIGGAFAITLNNCSAFFKNKNHLILIDCGENIFEKIIELDLLKDINSISLLITHFHSDHIGSIGTLLFYLDKIGISDIDIIYPNKPKIQELLQLLGVEKCNYQLFTPSEYKKIQIQEYKQEHSFMEAYGCLLKLLHKSVYYSGDTKSVPNEVLKMFLDKKIDYFFQDVRKEINDYHISIDELENIIPYDERENVHCMHFNSEDEMEYVASNGFKIVKKNERKK